MFLDTSVHSESTGVEDDVVVSGEWPKSPVTWSSMWLTLL